MPHKYGLRYNSPNYKQDGYFGPLSVPNSHGMVTTEYSIGVPINGKEMEIPSVVPTLSHNEITYLLSHENGQGVQDRRIQDSINTKAIDYAKRRLNDGKSVFWEPGDKVFPIPVNKVPMRSAPIQVPHESLQHNIQNAIDQHIAIRQQGTEGLGMSLLNKR